MFEQWKTVRLAQKKAKEKAKALYRHEMSLNKVKKDFLSGDDDPNFIAEIFKGIEGSDKVKVVQIKKLNGTTITIPLSTAEEKLKQQELDWIDFDALTDSQGIMRV